MINLILTDLNGTAYNFPASFDIKSQKISVNSSIQKLLYTHGGKELADGYLKPRQITIEGAVYADDQSTFETAKRALMLAALKGGYLSVDNDEIYRRIQVRLIDLDPDVFEFQIMDNVSLTFMAEYPFWEDTVLTEQVEVMTGNGTFQVDVTGTDDIIIPEIEITADQSIDLPSVKMYNYNDGGLAFEYNNPSFFTNSILNINGKAGTVTLDGNNSMVYFTTPLFLRLQPGVNNIYYEGAACTINVKYRKVYI